MSSPEEQEDTPTQVGWVPSPEQPTPPTTVEFDALVASGNAVPDDPDRADAAVDDPAEPEASAQAGDPGSTDDVDPTTRVIDPTPVIDQTPDSADATPAADATPTASDAEVGATATATATTGGAGVTSASEDAPHAAADAGTPAVDDTADAAGEPEPAPAATADAAPSPGTGPGGAYQSYVPPPPSSLDDDGPSTQTGMLGGLIPEDRPELLVAAAFAGGAVVAILLRTLVRR
ncbi:MAG: hypothetical protein AB7G37_15505 [Solirubrobacteraceae bacterium]